MVNNKSFAKSIQSVIAEIQKYNNLDNNRLVEIIEKAKVTVDDVKPFGNINHSTSESYGRTKIFEGKNFVMYLMTWNSGDFTAIHNHGLSDWGAVCFFSDTNHRSYKADGNKIELTGIGIIPKGTIATVTGSLVHAMGNLTENPIFTLHIYGSNNSIGNANDNSFVYELEKKQIRTTTGSAYINIDSKFCKKVETGIITNEETITDYFTIIQNYYKRNNISDMTEYLEAVLKNPELYFKN
jgi:hypothetical protein